MQAREEVSEACRPSHISCSRALTRNRRLTGLRQVVLFSATFPDYVVNYAKNFAPNANEITLKHEELTVEGIKQLYVECSSEDEKFDVLVRLYGLMTIGASIIFVKARSAKPCHRRVLGLHAADEKNCSGNRTTHECGESPMCMLDW